MAFDWTPEIEQNQINFWDFTAPNQFILDLYPTDIFKAFSLRKLRAAQTLCLRVRRDSDNGVLDIGFNGEDIDAAAIASFCGAALGFIQIWYDQSGNGRDMNQASPGLQPQIYDGAALTVDQEGNPAAYFKGSQIMTSTGQQTGSQNRHHFLFWNATTATTDGAANGYSLGESDGVGSTWRAIYDNNNNRLQGAFASGNVFSPSFYPPRALLQQVTKVSGTLFNTARVYFGTSNVTAGWTNPNNTLNTKNLNFSTISFSGQTDADFYISEILDYSANKETDQAAIGNNILNYYTAAQPSTPLLDQFPGEVQAFSLRRLHTSQVLCLRVRRGSDDQELDVGFIGNILDVWSIVEFCGTSRGYVRTWYDQSGNGRHLEQTITANQPEIYDGAAIHRDNTGNIAIWQNPAITSQLLATSVNIGNTITIFSVFGNDNSQSTTRARPWRTGTQGGAIAYGANWPQGTSSLTARIFTSGTNIDTSPDVSGYGGRTLTMFNSGNLNTTEVWDRSNAQNTGSPPSEPASFATISTAPHNAATAQTWLSEVIVYDSDQRGNRAAIEANQQQNWIMI